MKILPNQDLIISFLTWQVFIIILPAIHRFGGPILELTARERAVLYWTEKDLSGPPSRASGNYHPAEHQRSHRENAPEEHNPQTGNNR